MATVSCLTPRYGKAGAVIAPAVVVTVTWSPAAISSRRAVSGWISTQDCQAILLTGSGSSCSHGLLAPRPSPNVGDRYTTTSMSPVCAASAGAETLVGGSGKDAVRGAAVPAMIP